MKQDYIDVAATNGPSWWKKLEGAVDSIDCSPCQEKGQALLTAMHDLINVDLGKPVHDQDNLEHMAELYAQAVELASMGQDFNDDDDILSTWDQDDELEKQIAAALGQWVEA